MTVAVRVDTPVAAPERALRSVVRDYLSLTKPRIIVLLEVTAFAAMVMAARGWPGTGRALVTLAGGALSAGGANTINMWFDRDIDRTMKRTCGRPIASGRIGAHAALGFGVGLGVAREGRPPARVRAGRARHVAVDREQVGDVRLSHGWSRGGSCLRPRRGAARSRPRPPRCARAAP